MSGGEIPTHAVLIEHPEGRILWDTGVPPGTGVPAGKRAAWIITSQSRLNHRVNPDSWTLLLPKWVLSPPT